MVVDSSHHSVSPVGLSGIHEHLCLLQSIRDVDVTAANDSRPVGQYFYKFVDIPTRAVGDLLTVTGFGYFVYDACSNYCSQICSLWGT